ncbi:MAG: EAL and HDOD domain-containing protein [Burkholderiales bacterium]
MGNVYIARQPVFDEHIHLYGYELLYRKGGDPYDGTDNDQATAELLDNFFSIGFSRLIEGTRGFINFSARLLLMEAPLMLPPDKLVVEIHEHVKPDKEIIDVCRKLKERGYTLAIDDFVVGSEREYSKLLPLIDIIKIDCSEPSIEEKKKFLKKFRNRVSFLAEKVETIEDYERARAMGFKLFQGYFFSKPAVINARAIGMVSNNLMPILSELAEPEPDYDVIAGLIEKDLDLSYKLLRLANSVFSGARYTIRSIRQALVRMGTIELTRWINLMLLRSIKNTDNAELIKASLIRGKMLALFAEMTGQDEFEPDFFFTGIFSSIDALLGEDMEQIVTRLPLEDRVRNALLGEENFLRRPLEAVLSYENARWEEVDEFLSTVQLSRDVFISLYMDALDWQQSALADMR